MGLTVADTYYLKAKGAMSGFYSDWQEVTESLNYALSYDEHHCAALCLLGQVYAEQFRNFTKAFECFDKVIASNTNYSKVYPDYARYLIWENELERAEKIIAFAYSIKSIDKAQLHWLSSYIAENKGAYKSSLKWLKKAKKEVYNDNYFYFMEDEEKRIEKKIKLDKPKKKKKSKKKSKKKKKK